MNERKQHEGPPMTSTLLQQAVEARRSFEAWYEADAMPCEADWFKRDPDAPDEYDSAHTQVAWKAWQAALQQQPEPVAWLPRALELIGLIEGPIYSPKCEDLRQFLRELVAPPALQQQEEPREAAQAARDVLAERARQISAEGWTPEHDDDHESGEIAAAAAYYAMPPAAREWPATETGYGDTLGEAIAPTEWVMKDYGDRRRELVIAAALLLAEIERLDRAASTSPQDFTLPMVEEGKVSGLSEFVRNATPERKAEVYGRVMDAAAEKQQAVIDAAGVQASEPAPQRGDWRTWDVSKATDAPGAPGNQNSCSKSSSTSPDTPGVQESGNA